jgi:hypothetical protein
MMERIGSIAAHRLRHLTMVITAKSQTAVHHMTTKIGNTTNHHQVMSEVHMCHPVKVDHTMVRSVVHHHITNMDLHRR